MQQPIIILGKNGQLGRALTEQLGDSALAFGRQEVNLAAPDFIQQLSNCIGDRKYSALINATAYTQVDGAEEKGRDEAFHVNSWAVRSLAKWCAERKIPLVHVSTDYVFDGSGDRAWREDDKINPLNVYGKSKAEGEQAALDVGGDALIFRTSWVFDEKGKNFFTTILRLLHEKKALNIIADQYGAPTYAGHLATAIISALNKAVSLEKFPRGIYHLCAGGQTSWYEFAKAIFTLARATDSSIICDEINPIPASQYPLPAKRPYNSRLDCSKAEKILGVTMPAWEEGLNIVIRNLNLPK